MDRGGGEPTSLSSSWRKFRPGEFRPGQISAWPNFGLAEFRPVILLAEFRPGRISAWRISAWPNFGLASSWPNFVLKPRPEFAEHASACLKPRPELISAWEFRPELSRKLLRPASSLGLRLGFSQAGIRSEFRPERISAWANSGLRISASRPGWN